jgi:hypothetical protein
LIKNAKDFSVVAAKEPACSLLIIAKGFGAKDAFKITDIRYFEIDGYWAWQGGRLNKV